MRRNTRQEVFGPRRPGRTRDGIVDLATIAGLALAWGALLTALILEGGHPADLVLVSPLVLVLGGTLGATCVTVSLEEIRRLPTYLRLGLRAPLMDPLAVVNTMVDFARRARQEGILGLEASARRLENRFMRRGIELVVDGTPSELIREILETDIAAMLQRHRRGADLMATAGGFAPTMGIIGTVMGLIHMLKSLSEPGKMGPAIAAAFLATLYGVMLANLFFLPISNKLRYRSEQEAAIYEMIIEGVLAIQSGDNPRMVQMKMLAFLSPELQNRAARLREENPREMERRAA
ncbi:MAG: flagellar motor protein [Armatimonadota bacterium]